MTIYDVVYDEDQSQLFNMFLNPVTNVLYENNKGNYPICYVTFKSMLGNSLIEVVPS